MLKKLSLWLVKSLILLLFITFIFSTITVDMPSLIKNIFSDIFEYANPEVQKEVVNKLAESCSSLQVQINKIGTLCKNYREGRINDKEFYFGVITAPFDLGIVQTPESGFLAKYNQFITYLNNNKILYLIILLALIGLLYLLLKDIKLFLLTLSEISFGIGTLILLPYLAVLAYDKFIGIDTSSILGSVLGLSINPKAIISLVLLLFLRTYTSMIITLGVVFLGVGIVGKVYKRKYSKIQKAKAKKRV